MGSRSEAVVPVEIKIFIWKKEGFKNIKSVDYTVMTTKFQRVSHNALVLFVYVLRTVVL